MAYRLRGRGQFTSGVTRSGRSFVHDSRRVLVRGNNFTLNWNGPAIVASLQQSLANSLEILAQDALRYMQSIVPVDTEDLRNSCYANITIQADRMSVEIGASMPYAIYVELGTSSHTAQPYIRPTFDYIRSKLPGILQAEVRKNANAFT